VILSLVSLILLLGTNVRNTVYEYVPGSETEFERSDIKTSITADNRWDYEGYNYTEYAEQFYMLDSRDNNTDIAITNLLPLVINWTGAPQDTQFRIKDFELYIGAATDIITFHDTATNLYINDAGPGGAPNVLYGGWNGVSHPMTKNLNYTITSGNFTPTGSDVFPLALDSSTSFDWSDGVEMYYFSFQMAYVGQSINFSMCDPGTGAAGGRPAAPPWGYTGDIHMNVTTDQKFIGDWNINETWTGQSMGWLTPSNLFNITHNHTTAKYSLDGVSWYDFPRHGIRINDSGYHTIGINVSQGMWNIAKTYDVQVDVDGPIIDDVTTYRKLPYTIESTGTVKYTIEDNDSGLGNTSLYLDSVIQAISYTSTLNVDVDDWEEEDHELLIEATDLIGNVANLTYTISVSDATEFVERTETDYTDLIIAIIGFSGTAVAAGVAIWKGVLSQKKKKKPKSIWSKFRDYFK
jgi:hypothetical protein